MSTQRYSVTPHPIETLLTWVKSGEIAIPEIQRPFVWEPIKVRNLLDSLYQGYPVGYLIAWRNPTVRLKDGSTSKGKRILIDGQQRVTALMAALLGSPVLTKDYETVTIRIAFHPGEEKFEVTNPAIAKDPAWLPDVAAVFHHDASITELTDDYAEKNPNADRKAISKVLERLRKIIYNHVGIIELARPGLFMSVRREEGESRVDARRAMARRRWRSRPLRRGAAPSATPQTRGSRSPQQEAHE